MTHDKQAGLFYRDIEPEALSIRISDGDQPKPSDSDYFVGAEKYREPRWLTSFWDNPKRDFDEPINSAIDRMEAPDAFKAHPYSPHVAFANSLLHSKPQRYRPPQETALLQLLARQLEEGDHNSVVVPPPLHKQVAGQNIDPKLNKLLKTFPAPKKKPMKKQSLADVALLGGLPGALLGAAQAPKDHKAEGAARGNSRGLGTVWGGAMGALGGGILGGAAGHSLLRPDLIGGQDADGLILGALGGAAAGALGGGTAGYHLANPGTPSWESGEMPEGYRNRLLMHAGLTSGGIGTIPGAIGGGLLARQFGWNPELAGLGGSLATGVPAAVLGALVANKHIPKATSKKKPEEKPTKKAANDQPGPQIGPDWQKLLTVLEPEHQQAALREGALGAGVLGTVPGAFGGGMLGAGAGGALGTLLGAARGNTPEGLGRGAIRGGATGAGAGIGSSLGAGLGAAISGGPGGAAMGGLLGGGLGGAAGFFGSGALMGPPESQREEKPKKKRNPVYGESVPDDGPWYDRGKGQREQQLREWYDKQHGTKEEKQASICSFIGALTAKKEAADNSGFLGAATKSLAGAGKGLLSGLANPGGAAMSGAQSLMGGKSPAAPAPAAPGGQWGTRTMQAQLPPRPASPGQYGLNTYKINQRPSAVQGQPGSMPRGGINNQAASPGTFAQPTAPVPLPSLGGALGSSVVPAAGQPKAPVPLPSLGGPAQRPGGFEAYLDRTKKLQSQLVPGGFESRFGGSAAPALTPAIGGYSPQPGANGRSYMQKLQ